MPRLGSKATVSVPALSDKHTITQGGVDYSETNQQILGLLDGFTGNIDITGNLTVNSIPLNIETYDITISNGTYFKTYAKSSLTNFICVIGHAWQSGDTTRNFVIHEDSNEIVAWSQLNFESSAVTSDTVIRVYYLSG